mmetsp:Transcript_13058/g.56771  ORF Transcript_13058/g.56771 Transcript_13058/m.56771 type:complete len:227 (-) Transcript_13058:1337-2017(-)
MWTVLLTWTPTDPIRMTTGTRRTTTRTNPKASTGTSPSYAPNTAPRGTRWRSRSWRGAGPRRSWTRGNARGGRACSRGRGGRSRWRISQSRRTWMWTTFPGSSRPARRWRGSRRRGRRRRRCGARGWTGASTCGGAKGCTRRSKLVTWTRRYTRGPAPKVLIKGRKGRKDPAASGRNRRNGGTTTSASSRRPRTTTGSRFSTRTTVRAVTGTSTRNMPRGSSTRKK